MERKGWWGCGGKGEGKGKGGGGGKGSRRERERMVAGVGRDRRRNGVNFIFKNFFCMFEIILMYYMDVVFLELFLFVYYYSTAYEKIENPNRGIVVTKSNVGHHQKL